MGNGLQELGQELRLELRDSSFLGQTQESQGRSYLKLGGGRVSQKDRE